MIIVSGHDLTNISPPFLASDSPGNPLAGGVTHLDEGKKTLTRTQGGVSTSGKKQADYQANAFSLSDFCGEAKPHHKNHLPILKCTRIQFDIAAVDCHGIISMSQLLVFLKSSSTIT